MSPSPTSIFYNFLKDRCHEDGRADLHEILAQAGMTENNPYQWVRLTHGVTWDDFFGLNLTTNRYHLTT